MLILTRKDSQSIKIGEEIEIQVVSSAKNNVKLGIKAPKNVIVLRTELTQEVANENKKASCTQIDDFIELKKKFQK